jgi:hypothetical protein
MLGRATKAAAQGLAAAGQTNTTLFQMRWGGSTDWLGSPVIEAECNSSRYFELQFTPARDGMDTGVYGRSFPDRVRPSFSIDLDGTAMTAVVINNG